MNRVETCLSYPRTRIVDRVDEIHGVRIADPYRWLEDGDAPETRAWIEEQNRLTFEWLGGVEQRGAILARLTELWNYARYGIPERKGSRYFYTRNDGLQNQPVLLVADSIDAEPRLLLDPNTLSADGTVSLSAWAPSEDGKLLAYALSSGGSDWMVWQILDVATGERLPDRIEWVKFSGVSWSPDGSGFYYSCYDPPAPGSALQEANYHQKLCYHRLGTDSADDRRVYERPDRKEWGFDGRVTEDGDYLVITVWQGTDPRNRIFYADLRDPDGRVVELLNDFDAGYSFVGNEGAQFYFMTDADAPRRRVVRIDLARPARSDWTTLVPQRRETLESVSLVGGHLIARYLEDARSEIRLLDLDGRIVRALELPGPGTALGFGGRADDPETFFEFTSFSVPSTIYRYDVASGEARPLRAPSVAFDPADYETKQVFYASKDGTRVPMFISHRRDLPIDGNRPTLLTGYGGFDIAITPTFSVANLVWMEMGGIHAVANIRGGGEYGKEWHEAGTKHRKQNVFDDFIAAAEWLIASGYTRSSRLAIAGGSNGGLLVGACLTQRPDLFGAALPAVGVLDMLRFHKFTIGWAWTSDYGSPDDPEEFRALHAYSPLHRIRPGGRYPATLITTGDHDDRVVPAHSFKFAATLQAAQAGPAPILIRVETRAGHGAGKPVRMAIEEAADRWAFLERVLGPVSVVSID